MITSTALLTEIEKYIAIAKNVKDENQIREHFSAIRAICDVALLMNPQQNSNQQNQNQNQNQSQNQMGLSGSAQQLSNMMNNPSPNAKMLDGGANGDSIFDF